jgi:hypothetical protein
LDLRDLPDQLVLRVFKVLRVPKDNKDLKAILVQSDHKACKALLVSQVQLDLKAPKVLQALLDRRVQPDQLDLKEFKVHKEIQDL